MSDFARPHQVQCPRWNGDIRCQRTKGHEGHHRAETKNGIQDWPERTKR